MDSKAATSAKKSKVVASVKFTREQQSELEKSTGLNGLTGLDLLELGADERARISPGLAQAKVAVLCW